MSRIRVNSIKPIGGNSVSVSGSLVVTGNVTAEEFITEKVSTSIIYKSGSTKFGDTADDRHEMTGTLDLTGSAVISSNLELGAIANVETYVSIATASISTLDGHVENIHATTASHDTRISTAEGHIENLHAFTGSLNDTYATDAELAAVSGALATSINTSVAGLNAASSSYALAADLTIATGSINVNETNIGLLTALTGSLVSTQKAYNTLSGSYALSSTVTAVSSSASDTYVSIAKLKAIVTGSADFATFQANILSL